MPERKRVLVNAIPMCSVNTGIARYLRCLYMKMELLYANEFEFWYFDGRGISQTMPPGPKNLDHWSRLVDLFWKLPVHIALLIRLGVHVRCEFKFVKLAKGFDLYHEAGFFPLRTPREVKTIFTIHDLSLLKYPKHHPRERILYTKLFFQSRCRRVAHFISVSEFTKTEMHRYLQVQDDNVTVTPLAHDSSNFFLRQKENAVSFLHTHNLPEKYFLFVGSGDPRKNMWVIPEALQRSGIDIPLLVVGWSGWSSKRMPDNVITAGYVGDEHLALLYTGALSLVFPSIYEGFGLPVLEAMACGCPVVTTREASLQEVGGEAAAYVQDPQDAEELGLLLTELASSLEKRRSLGQQGLDRAKGFSWERTARLTRDVFWRVLDHA